MEPIEWVGHITIILLSAFIGVLTLRAHVEIRKCSKSLLQTQFSTVGISTTGRIVYRWLLILVGVS
uniref:hypothetical protein n=1 Tax=Dyadobacter sp. TaxID=1914288 RepID=UPI003F718EC5